MIKILMIEDDMELAEILTEYLENYDIKVTTAEEPYIGLSTLNTGELMHLTMERTTICQSLTTRRSS